MQRRCRAGFSRSGRIPIPEVERALQRANRIVVCLLAPVVSIGDADQLRIADLLKDKLTEVWAPDAVEYLAIRVHRGRRHIVAPLARFAMREVLVKDVTAALNFSDAGQAFGIPIVRELFGVGKDAQLNLALDDAEPFPGAAQQRRHP